MVDTDKLETCDCVAQAVAVFVSFPEILKTNVWLLIPVKDVAEEKLGEREGRLEPLVATDPEKVHVSQAV